MIFYLDFDGTVVEHQFPNIGVHNPGSENVLKQIHEANHEIILNTYRVNLFTLGKIPDVLDYLKIIGYDKYVTTYLKSKAEPKPYNIPEYIDKGIFFYR